MYYIKTREFVGYKYKNALEYILDRHFKLNKDEDDYIYLNNENERDVVNRLYNFKEYINVVYWGVKNGLSQYKIIAKDIQGLNKIYEYKEPVYKDKLIPCTKDEYESYMEIESNLKQ